MKIQRYKDDHYSDVKHLVLNDGGFDCFPEKGKLGGHGLVSFDEDGYLAGFVWALTSSDSSMAYIDYFVVREDLRGERQYGPKLMDTLMLDLIGLGKTIIAGTMLEDNPYTETLAKIYNKVGMDFYKAKYLVHGETEKIFKGIRSLYGK